jgi:hypothetical protein
MVVTDHQKSASLLRLMRIFGARCIPLKADARGNVRNRNLSKDVPASVRRGLRDTNEEVCTLESSPQPPDVKPANRTMTTAPFLHRPVRERNGLGCEDEEIVHNNRFRNVARDASWNEMGLFLIGDQQHEPTPFSSALLQALAHAAWVKPPSSKQTSWTQATKRMIHFCTQAPALHLMAGQQTHDTGVSSPQPCASTEGTASDHEHVPVHVSGTGRNGLKVAPVKVHFRHQIETVDRRIGFERNAEPAPRPVHWRHGRCASAHRLNH